MRTSLVKAALALALGGLLFVSQGCKEYESKQTKENNGLKAAQTRASKAHEQAYTNAQVVDLELAKLTADEKLRLKEGLNMLYGVVTEMETPRPGLRPTMDELKLLIAQSSETFKAGKPPKLPEMDDKQRDRFKQLQDEWKRVLPFLANASVDPDRWNAVNKEFLAIAVNLDAALAAVPVNASGVNEISIVASRIESQSLLGLIYYQLGNRYYDRALPLDPTITHKLWRITVVTNRVRDLNARIATVDYQIKDRVEPLIADNDTEIKAEEKAVADAQTKLTAQETHITDIKTQIQSRRAKIADFNKQASELGAQAVNLKPIEAQPLLDKKTDLEKQAQLLDAEIEQIHGVAFPPDPAKRPADDVLPDRQNKLKTLQLELQAAKARLANRMEIQADLKKTMDEVQAQKTALVALLPPMIVEAEKHAAELAELQTKSRALREQAWKYLEESAKYYEQASNDSKTLSLTLSKWMTHESFSKSQEKKAWENLASNFNLNRARLRKAQSLELAARAKSDLIVQRSVHKPVAESFEAARKRFGANNAPKVEDLQKDTTAGLRQDIDKLHKEVTDDFAQVFKINDLGRIKDIAGVARFGCLLSKALLDARPEAVPKDKDSFSKPDVFSVYQEKIAAAYTAYVKYIETSSESEKSEAQTAATKALEALFNSAGLKDAKTAIPRFFNLEGADTAAGG